MENFKEPVFFAGIRETHELAKYLPNFDPQIPMPFAIIEKSEGEKPELTVEMIISGMLYVFANDRENAHFEYYKQMFLELQPNALAKLTEVAVLQTDNYVFSEAEALFLAIEGLYPDDKMTKLNLALFYEKRSDFYRQSDLTVDANINEDRAEAYYKELIMAEPPLPQGFFNAASFYVKQKKYKDALSLFKTYLKIETDDSPSAQARKERAEEVIDRISKQKLDDIAYLDAIAFINSDECEKALDRIRTFLGENPKAWNGWFVLGWALRKLERWEDAKASFLECLKLGQKSESIAESYSDICNELAICLTELGDFDTAEQWLVSALENDTENIKIISNIGAIQYRKGNMEEAAGFFKTVLTLNPEDIPAKEMLKKIEENNQKK